MPITADSQLVGEALRYVTGTFVTMDKAPDCNTELLNTPQAVATAHIVAQLLQPLSVAAARQAGRHTPGYVILPRAAVVTYLVGHAVDHPVLLVGLRHLITARFVDEHNDDGLLLKPRVGWDGRQGAIALLGERLVQLVLPL